MKICRTSHSTTGYMFHVRTTELTSHIRFWLFLPGKFSFSWWDAVFFSGTSNLPLNCHRYFLVNFWIFAFPGHRKLLRVSILLVSWLKVKIARYKFIFIFLQFYFVLPEHSGLFSHFLSFTLRQFHVTMCLASHHTISSSCSVSQNNMGFDFLLFFSLSWFDLAFCPLNFWISVSPLLNM